MNERDLGALSVFEEEDLASFFTQVRSLDQVGLTSVLYLSILSGLVGYLLFFAIVGQKSVSSFSVHLYLILIVDVVGGPLLLKELVTILTVTGGAMVLAVVALATRR